MPELPEVETTLRGILPHVKGKTITDVHVRQAQLRWPVPTQLASKLSQRKILAVTRRAKYLLLTLSNGTVIIHLGMSGSLRYLDAQTPAQKHDHVDIIFADNHCLRLRDPRRFGAVLWSSQDISEHPLLRSLGPEPLSSAFNAAYLFACAQQRKIAIKSFIMDSHIVVGVGNIYANEALFQCGIHPTRAAGRIAMPRYENLVVAIKQVLRTAIQQGGTTLRDFTSADGKPGYFRHALQVYDRSGQPCTRCTQRIRKIILGQRSTFYCTHCQH